mmetsp:Transcript_7777/g.21186  ORF Transcript_7777/g.21186 Transcript_7777/m.21186 type:complete len:233 (+) Transcript_7777:661-1359(+)
MLERLDGVLLGVEGLSLVLLKIIGHDAVFSHLNLTLCSLFTSHDQAEQGALSGTIWSDDRDALPLLDLQTGVLEQRATVVAVGQSLDGGRNASHTLGRWEREVSLPGHERLLHKGSLRLHLFDGFLGCRRATGIGTGRQPTHNLSLAVKLLLLLFPCGPLLRDLLLLLSNVLGVVTLESLGDPSLRLDDLRAECVQECTIVRYNDDGQVLLLEVGLKPVDGVQVQVIRRLVE